MMARTQSGSATKTVLVVEDDESISMGLEMNLTAEGYRILLAADGEAGLEFARTADIDLMILDVMLPRLNGFELLRTLRGERRLMPIIMLSARGAEMEVARGAGCETSGDTAWRHRRMLRESNAGSQLR